MNDDKFNFFVIFFFSLLSPLCVYNRGRAINEEEEEVKKKILNEKRLNEAFICQNNDDVRYSQELLTERTKKIEENYDYCLSVWPGACA